MPTCLLKRDLVISEAPSRYRTRMREVREVGDVTSSGRVTMRGILCEMGDICSCIILEYKFEFAFAFTFAFTFTFEFAFAFALAFTFAWEFEL